MKIDNLLILLGKLFAPIFIITCIYILYFGLKPGITNHFNVIVLIFFVFLSCLFNSNKTSIKTKKVLKTSIITVLVIFTIHFLLNMINVYSFSTNQRVLSLCSNSLQVCNILTLLFYNLKIYRFITLPPEFFTLLLFLLTGLSIVYYRKNDLKKYLNNSIKDPILLFVFCLIVITLSSQLITISERVYRLSIQSWNNRNVNFLDRFVPYEFGIEHHGWIWEYGKFVLKNTPESAIIFIPPQSDIWPQEGNKYYFRWFVYPRSLIQSNDPQALIPNNTQFVLISRGGWHGGSAGWPKKLLNIDCIDSVHLINRLTLNERVLEPSLLESELESGEWGIIKLNNQDLNTCQ